MLPQLTTPRLHSTTALKDRSTQHTLPQLITPRPPSTPGTKAPEYYTTTYATPRYYDEAPNYYTEKATHYTITYTAPVYFTKYDSAPSYYQTEAPIYYTKATGYYNQMVNIVSLHGVLYYFIIFFYS
jgi:hypothetical protein